MNFYALYNKSSFIYLLPVILRHLVQSQYIYLPGSTFKLAVGVDLPIAIDIQGGSLSWFANLQAIYHLPDNVTYYEPYKIVQKRSVKSTFNRLTVYQALNKFFDRHEVSGSECIQKLICEISRRKLDEFSSSLVGDVINIVFSPNKDDSYGLNEYRNAQRQGIYNKEDCGIIYSNCTVKENSVFYNWPFLS